MEQRRPRDPDLERVTEAVDALVRAAAAEDEAFLGLSLLLADYCLAKSAADILAEQLRAHGIDASPAAGASEDARARENVLNAEDDLTPWQRQLLRTVMLSLPRANEAGSQIGRLVRVIAGRSEDLAAYRRETSLLAAAMIRAMLVPTLGTTPMKELAGWLVPEADPAGDR